jgi:hypothetical protein
MLQSHVIATRIQLPEVGASEKRIFQIMYGRPGWRGHEILLCFSDSFTSAPEKRFTITIGSGLWLGVAVTQPPSLDPLIFMLRRLLGSGMRSMSSSSGQ